MIQFTLLNSPPLTLCTLLVVRPGKQFPPCPPQQLIIIFPEFDIPLMEAGPKYRGTKNRVHAETSVLWVSKHYNLTVDVDSGSICYDIVRAIPSIEENGIKDGSPTILCSYKSSRKEACFVF